MENFSYSIYLKLLEKDDNSIADEYKNRFIPKYLYKYASFDKNTLYKEKMEQLEKEQSKRQINSV